MDIYSQIARFDDLILFIQNELPNYAAEVAANDLVALITNRVTIEGKDQNGNSFSSYSTNPIAAGKLWGKSRTQEAERKVRALAKARGALSYKEFREINNLKTDKKNFEFTGEMFRKFGVVRNSSGPDGAFTVTMAGLTSEAQMKLDENSEQEGQSIIEASEEEKEIIALTLQSWFDENANRILNG